MKHQPERRLLSTVEAAGFLAVSEHWLKAARYRPELAGPSFIKIGRTVRHDPRDLDQWLCERKFRGTHEITSQYKEVHHDHEN